MAKKRSAPTLEEMKDLSRECSKYSMKTTFLANVYNDSIGEDDDLKRKQAIKNSAMRNAMLLSEPRITQISLDRLEKINQETKISNETSEEKGIDSSRTGIKQNIKGKGNQIAGRDMHIKSDK